MALAVWVPIVEAARPKLRAKAASVDPFICYLLIY